jgi:hypothetical protein
LLELADLFGLLANQGLSIVELHLQHLVRPFSRVVL